MTINDHIIDRKLQYGINSEAAKTSELRSDKIDKYECLRAEENLLSDQSRMTKQAMFTFFPKQIKKIEDQRRKQVEVLKILKPVGHQQKPKSIAAIAPKRSIK